MTITNSKLHLKTEIQQLRLLHKSVASTLLVVIVLAVIYAFVLWGEVDQKSLEIWLFLALILPIARLVIFYYNWKSLTEENADTFRQFLLIGNLISGLLWGASTVWFFPEQLEYQLFMLFMLGGIALGASNSDVNYLPGYYAYIWSSLSLLVIALIWVGEEIQMGIGITTILFIIAISIYGRASHKTTYESIKLRFENDDLVQKLEEKTLLAEKANTSKSKFLATASHDLRQPLHTSVLLLDALRFTLEKDSQNDILDKLVRSHDHLSTLFDSLLDISNLDSGSVNVNLQAVSIPELYSSLEEEYSLAAQKKGLNFSIEPINGFIKTDPILISRIIGNLLSNAIRYTPKGAITLGAIEDQNQLLITVTDTGIGISNDHHQQIFNEFEQLNNSHRDYRLGLGLGLSIVKRLSDLLDHEIKLDSTKGSGSTFSLRCQTENPQQETMHAAAVLTDIDVKRRLNILFVDDEKPVREAISLVLNNFDMNVITAESASEAIEHLANMKPSLDVIVADYRLKNGETGFDVIEKTCEFMNADIPSIIVTGEANFDQMKPAQRKNVVIVQKPISSAVLMPLILERINKEG
ncbi:ATP-binding protein [Arenicella sp. 4NH20-0111]|uniref:ATP-binding response regulator n=1 Tax=Arenicella sp. 4NH20-0111 TaxID=3127648 RepID=UPI003107C5A0